ncbi:ABC transporter permease, partial [Clostridium sp. cpc1]|uniref:ABC transporter permease n=1 Tax=Clostridium sp. cpc1 TaxID=2016536 RepID=UPI0022406A4D
FEYFIKRALEKTKEEGYLAFVVPINFSRNSQYIQLRNEILNEYEIKNLFFNISFAGVITDGMVFILKKNKKCFNKIKIKVQGKDEYRIDKYELFSCNEYGFAYDNNSCNEKIKNKILENSSFLSEISDTFTGFIGDCKYIYKDNVDKSCIKIYKGKNIKKFICHSYFYYDFRDENIQSRRKISSKKFLQFNKEMYLGQLILASMITLVFILGSILLKGKYIGEVNFGKYVINTIVFSFSILCLTFLINNITKNKFIINALSTVLSLGTAFISGVMVPQEFLGEKTLMIAKFFPTYYFVKINEMRVNSFLDMKFEIFMQLLFAVVFLLMGLYFSK